MISFGCRAINAGITVMNEVGVDPGIDHLLAVECFDEARDHGAKVNGNSNVVVFI